MARIGAAAGAGTASIKNCVACPVEKLLSATRKNDCVPSASTGPRVRLSTLSGLKGAAERGLGEGQQEFLGDGG